MRCKFVVARRLPFSQTRRLFCNRIAAEQEKKRARVCVCVRERERERERERDDKSPELARNDVGSGYFVSYVYICGTTARKM